MLALGDVPPAELRYPLFALPPAALVRDWLKRGQEQHFDSRARPVHGRNCF